ncbi:MAG TPA: TetR/AcrR family transcriptional regulator [Acidimicrobiales bacterium]|nr:TetR/AcrR family transcriptional regulator [Acidimicrobiales bacterium]
MATATPTATPTARVIPRGPHGLSPGEVLASQRERVFSAIIAAVAEKGYVHTSVADVLSRARVSRLTFYQLFRDKEECFVAAFEARATLLVDVLRAVLDDVAPVDVGGVLGRVDLILQTYLQALQSEPASARALLIEVYAAGPRALQQRHRALQQFVQVVNEALGDQPDMFDNEDEQRFAAQLLVGGVSSLVTTMVGAGQIDELGGLRGPLVKMFQRLR